MTTDLIHLSRIRVAGFLETYNLILGEALNNLNLGIDEAFVYELPHPLRFFI